MFYIVRSEDWVWLYLGPVLMVKLSTTQWSRALANPKPAPVNAA